MESAIWFSALILTPTLDGISTVMSPFPVARYDSASLLPTRFATMLPIDVDTRMGPVILPSWAPRVGKRRGFPAPPPPPPAPPHFPRGDDPCRHIPHDRPAAI